MLSSAQSSKCTLTLPVLVSCCSVCKVDYTERSSVLEKKVFPKGEVIVYMYMMMSAASGAEVSMSCMAWKDSPTRGRHCLCGVLL